MDRELSDLLPLFLAETRDRLERLHALLPRWKEKDTVVELRRELHTIKGAARMLQLTEIAEVAHGAENLLADGANTDETELTGSIDRLTGLVEAVEEGGGDAEPSEAPAAAPQERGRTQDLRVAASFFDGITDRATRLRILALAAGQLVAQLSEVARIAEQGGDEEHARQVLPMLGAALRRIGGDMERGQRRLRRSAEAQLESLLELQLQPLRGFLQSLARHGRELARTLGREVEITLDGQETRLDRRIARELEEALLHLVRNAIDHGIEPPARRRKAKKPVAGRVHISAATEGGRVRLTVADDGRGIDVDDVLEKAVARGLLDRAAASALDRDEALRLVFTPGFSTRDSVTEVSGRGAGLDVVAAAAARVGGQIAVDAEPGRGCSISLDVPVARRGEQIIVARVGALTVGVPSPGIRRFSWVTSSDVVERDDRLLAREDDRLIPFVSLNRLFGEPSADPQLLLHGLVGGQHLTVAVDSIVGEEEVLLRPVPGVVPGGTLLDGVTLLASGEPVGILSLARLPRGRVRAARAPAETGRRLRSLRVLLVEDSLVTREMERRLLEDAGFVVTPTGDPGEALSLLAEAEFDCVVTDVEMPVMDGYELTRRLRAIPHLAQLPVVVVSTRDRPEDRIKGLSAGADAYLTKQGLDATELVALVRRLGGS